MSSVVPTPFDYAQGRLFENREGWGSLTVWVVKKRVGLPGIDHHLAAD